MAYGYIYKITTTQSNKVYIGQTTKTVEARFKAHIKSSTEKAKKTVHLYEAMNKYGVDTFSVEEIDIAETREELDQKEIYWINYYDSIKNGYNMAPGGVNANIFDSEIIRQKHANKMRSEETRAKISKTMHELRTTVGFSEEHKRKIRESSQKRKEERAKLGLKFYDDCAHCATRSRAVYCILDTGERFDFDSIIHAGKWWYENYKPFGEIYSVPTFQRKIEASIAGRQITFGNPTHKCYKIINNIKWFYKEEEVNANEKVC